MSTATGNPMNVPSLFLKCATRRREPKALIYFLLSCCLLAGVVRGGATSTILQATPSPVTFGASLTLTATVTPSSATGKVTFYDGSLVLGTSSLSGGVAVETVHLYSTGRRSLFARYEGDSTNTGSPSAPVTVTVTSTPAAGFASSSVDMGFALNVVAVGDFNGDGKVDIIAAGSSNSVKTVLGNGDGTFGSPITSFVGGGSQITGVYVTDFDGDGKADIVLVVTDEQVVKVLFGNGDGTFGGVISLPVTNGAVAVGDFNIDGFPDIAVANNSSIQILLGNGNRTFQSPASYPAASSLPDILVADVNGDGQPDLVTVAPPLVNDNRRLMVLLGHGDGTFAAAQTSIINVGSYNATDRIALEDLNGDGKPDLILAGGLTQFATVLLGNGDGTFGIPALYNANGTDQGSSLGLTVVDVNADGKQDVVMNVRRSSSAVDELQLYDGNGDGSLTAPPDVFFAPSADNRGLVKADFDGNGRVAFALVDATASNTLVRIIHGSSLALLRISRTQTTPVILTTGQSGSFTVTVTNVGLSATVGTVTITQTLSSNLTFQSMSGTGWTCTANSCSRSDALAPASSYPPITVSLGVSVNAQAQEGGATNVTGTFISAELDETFAVTSPTCSYSLGSSSATFIGAGGVGSVNVITTSGCTWTAVPNVPWITVTSGSPGSGNGTVNYSVLAFSGQSQQPGTITIAGQTLAVTEEGVGSEVGIFRAGLWALNATGDENSSSASNRYFRFGQTGDILVEGDWNGDGTTKVGIFRNGLWVLNYDGDGNSSGVSNKYFVFGQAGDVPVVGDWNGDGKAKIGIFRNGLWVLNYTGDGDGLSAGNRYFYFGQAGDVPVVGDWNGDGKAKKPVSSGMGYGY